MGGDDGAQPSAVRLATPYIFAARFNHHSVAECLSIHGLVEEVEKLPCLIDINCETGK